MFRPLVAEWLHESGVLVGLVAKSYEYEATVIADDPARKTWHVQVWEIATGQPAFYAVATSDTEPPELPERKQFVRFIRDRFDTVESMCEYVNEQLARTVDV